MRVNECVKCGEFSCADVMHNCYIIPDEGFPILSTGRTQFLYREEQAKNHRGRYRLRIDSGEVA